VLFGTAVATTVAVVRTHGYPVPEGRRLRALSPWQYAVVEHASRRIVAPDREADGPDSARGAGDATIPSPDELEVAAFVDSWMGYLPRLLRRDLGRFLAYLEHIAPLAAGFASRFTHLDATAQDAVLSSLENSSVDLLRAGFDGLRSLIFFGYYRHPRSWSILRYDGPLVGRPPLGWR
jgi:hypothetical protein